MTNFERIKNMETAELADFLMSIYTMDYDAWGELDMGTYIGGWCFNRIEECIEWLESECETEENVG